MKKILLIIAIVLLAFIIVIGIAVGFYLGPIVKLGIESIGPKITKVPVTVAAVDMSLLTGSAEIKNLVVGNPQGYKTPRAISVGTASVSVDPFSVLSKKIIVHSVKVESPEITFEGGLGGNNLNKIVSNAAAVSQNPSASAKASTGPGNKPAPNIEVDDFLITGAKVHVSIKGLGGREMTLSLPDIHLTDLGKQGNGLDPAELTRTVLEAITTSTVQAVSGSIASLSKGVRRIEGINTITNAVGSFFGK
ncbi:MAG: hypothetical protein KGK03_04690 [Candidatus Omnitrophica bacterium]|nr:hypothetical protein [Candidatus Omnitrophota bacterium]MDE2222350.1 hypothetical protein [Candidatus Omnitrophota bacterium]